MSKILGLLDALETMILESKKVPLTDKVIIQEHDVLTVINKIRLVLNSQDDIINQKIQVNQSNEIIEQNTKPIIKNKASL